jgi:flagellar protein FlaG
MQMSSVITGNFAYPPTTAQPAAGNTVELNQQKGSAENAVVSFGANPNSVQEEQGVSAEQLGQAVEDVNQFVNAQGRTLNFSVDEESGKPVVKVIDFETKEVIRQIPSEEVLTMAKAIKRLQEDLGSTTGLMFDKTI